MSVDGDSDSDDSGRLSPLLFLDPSTVLPQVKPKSIDDLLNESSCMIEDLKDTLSNFQHLDKEESSSQDSIQDPNNHGSTSSEIEKTELDEFNCCVKPSVVPERFFGDSGFLQFFSLKDLDLMKYGYCQIPTELLSKTEKALLSWPSETFQSIFSHSLKGFSNDSFKDLNPIIHYALRVVSVHEDSFVVNSCATFVKRMLREHLNVASISFSSEDIFTILFNHGVDIKNAHIFKLLPLSKKINFQDSMIESINKLPQNWKFNLKLLLNCLADIFQYCKFNNSDLRNILLYLLMMSVDESIRACFIYLELQKCLRNVLLSFSDNLWSSCVPWLLSTLTMQKRMLSEKQLWSFILLMTRSIPFVLSQGVQLRTQLAFISIRHICDHNDIRTPFRYPEESYVIHEFLDFLESIPSVPRSMQSICIDFIGIFLLHYKFTSEDEYTDVCTAIKVCEKSVYQSTVHEENLSEVSEITLALQLLKIYSTLKLLPPKYKDKKEDSCDRDQSEPLLTAVNNTETSYPLLKPHSFKLANEKALSENCLTLNCSVSNSDKTSNSKISPEILTSCGKPSLKPCDNESICDKENCHTNKVSNNNAIQIHKELRIQSISEKELSVKFEQSSSSVNAASLVSRIKEPTPISNDGPDSLKSLTSDFSCSSVLENPLLVNSANDKIMKECELITEPVSIINESIVNPVLTSLDLSSISCKDYKSLTTEVDKGDLSDAALKDESSKVSKCKDTSSKSDVPSTQVPSNSNQILDSGPTSINFHSTKDSVVGGTHLSDPSVSLNILKPDLKSSPNEASSLQLDSKSEATSPDSSFKSRADPIQVSSSNSSSKSIKEIEKPPSPSISTSSSDRMLSNASKDSTDTCLSDTINSQNSDSRFKSASSKLCCSFKRPKGVGMRNTKSNLGGPTKIKQFKPSMLELNNSDKTSLPLNQFTQKCADAHVKKKSSPSKFLSESFLKWKRRLSLGNKKEAVDNSDIKYGVKTNSSPNHSNPSVSLEDSNCVSEPATPLSEPNCKSMSSLKSPINEEKNEITFTKAAHSPGDSLSNGLEALQGGDLSPESEGNTPLSSCLKRSTTIVDDSTTLNPLNGVANLVDKVTEVINPPSTITNDESMSENVSNHELDVVSDPENSIYWCPSSNSHFKRLRLSSPTDAISPLCLPTDDKDASSHQEIINEKMELDNTLIKPSINSSAPSESVLLAVTKDAFSEQISEPSPESDDTEFQHPILNSHGENVAKSLIVSSNERSLLNSFSEVESMIIEKPASPAFPNPYSFHSSINPYKCSMASEESKALHSFSKQDEDSSLNNCESSKPHPASPIDDSINSTVKKDKLMPSNIAEYLTKTTVIKSDLSKLSPLKIPSSPSAMRQLTLSSELKVLKVKSEHSPQTSIRHRKSVHRHLTQNNTIFSYLVKKEPASPVSKPKNNPSTLHEPYLCKEKNSNSTDNCVHSVEKNLFGPKELPCDRSTTREHPNQSSSSPLKQYEPHSTPSEQNAKQSESDESELKVIFYKIKGPVCKTIMDLGNDDLDDNIDITKKHQEEEDEVLIMNEVIKSTNVPNHNVSPEIITLD